MKWGAKHRNVWGALVLCVLAAGCVRKDLMYPSVVSIPVAVVVRPDAGTPVVPPPPEVEAVVEPDQPPPPPEPPPEPLPAVSPPDVPRPEPVRKIEPAPAVSAPAQSSTVHFSAHSFFINREVRSENIRMFPRWVDMLSRYSAEAHTLDAICGTAQYSPCRLKEWKGFLEGLRGAPLAKQVESINRFLNSYPYIDDIVNWGVDNYWETPYEFQRKSGNCKDYAIAKLMSLRALGVPNDAMRITVLRDMNLGGIIHAVLVISIDGRDYMLDNQIKQVVPTDKVYHYIPIYSINEQYWWQHFM